ncbi:MAG: hypothetical protein D6766_00905 [Verrucomicrobia bacterium]|nr:MAG: hypothetical protein D6766_00905 [Verrucomicrobiota bacterium]
MSIKAVHFLFITLMILLSGGGGLAALRAWRDSGQTGHLALGVLGVLAALAFAAYFRVMLRKLKNVSLL